MFSGELCLASKQLYPPQKKNSLYSFSAQTLEFNIFRQNALPHHAIDLQIHIGISLRYNPQVEKHEPNQKMT